MSAASQNLEVGDGCGLKVPLHRTFDIASYNSGGENPHNARRLAQHLAMAVASKVGINWDQDFVGDCRQLLSEDNSSLQPGLDAGFHYIENLGVYSVSTTDAMTPPTSNPEEYGRIAALHVLSDLWVSGVDGETMQQYLVHPKVDDDNLEEILHGYLSVCNESGVRITGGHSRREGTQYLLGGTATGYSHRRFDTNTLHSGDLIAVTKKLGTSITIAADKLMGTADSSSLPMNTEASIESGRQYMLLSNRFAVKLKQDNIVNECTDITGFGLVGHLSNFINPAGLNARIYLSSIPTLDGAEDLLTAGIHTHAGDEAQISYASTTDRIDLLSDPRFHLAFLPETSGGVLSLVSERNLSHLYDVAAAAGQEVTVIGEITNKKQPSTNKQKPYFSNVDFI